MSLSSSNVGENYSHEAEDVVPAWKQELNERLAATRSRRLRIQGEQVALPGMEQIESKVPTRASRLAAKVAQRYANAPSYSEVLTDNGRSKGLEAPPAVQVPQPLTEIRTGVLEAEWVSGKVELQAAIAPEHQPPVVVQPVMAEAPEEPVVEPLAVNLVEFPRELVAARKARPRLAEGPLRESSQPVEKDQLKIFEVAPDSISQTVKVGAAAMDWSPIRLDTDPVSSAAADQSKTTAVPLQSAALEDRVMAGIFDLALVVAAFALFVLVFVACTTHPPTGRPAMIAAGLALGSFFVLYQYLFFKFAEGTPGMRYAKIALCTFEDENPTRKAMCRRVFFLLLAAAPLGLGFIWACFDPDRLGWHDRMSRIYQRSYS